MAPLTDHQELLLAAAVDQIVAPHGSRPGGWAGGVEAFVGAQWETTLSWAHEAVAHALDELAGGMTVAEISAAGRSALVRLTHEGFYGAPDHPERPGWKAVGFEPLPTGVEAVEPDALPTIRLADAADGYDTVVVGAGAGGGVIAAQLAAAGETVLLVERARQHSSSELRNDHLRGKRAAVYAPLAGPAADETRVWVEAGGREKVVDSGDLRWGLNAMTVGGGVRLWQAQAWRFLPDDFRMASVYGVPAGSTLVDWPISYEDMAPWYETAEDLIGVSGDRTFLDHYRPQDRDFPMPALPTNARGEAMGAAAARLGWRTGQLSYAINSVPRHGRAACVQCMQCVGHACPVDAKNGSHNTVVRRTLRAGGNLTLVSGARVLRVEHAAGNASGVTVTDGEAERRVRAGRVVVAAGAAETPRLLLWSGLGNEEVGRHLQAHNYSLVWGRHPDRFGAWDGPGHAVATLDFNHHNGAGIIGGGVLHDGTQFLPVAVASMLAPMFTGHTWGPEHTAFMTEGVHHMVSTMACGQEIPSETARVSLDPKVTDDAGVPVVRFSGAPHPADDAAHEFLCARGVEWLEELGCEPIIDIGEGYRAMRASGVTAGEHGAGTCRMGDDPTASATDRFGKVHGTANVYVADASLHPTNAGLNPGLTVMANAFRIADHLSS